MSDMYLMVLGLFKILFLQIILSRMTSFSKFFARFQYFINTQLAIFRNYSKVPIEISKKQPSFDDSAKKTVDDGLHREEVELIMERLGFFCHPEGELLQERLFSADISNLFEEKEPCLDEIKAAFMVFDQNGDGFIDAKELQRVLCVLGLKERAEMEDCKRMIRLHDQNGDGKINLYEFAKFMEKSLC